MATIQEKIRLARAFGAGMQTLSVSDFREMIDRNKTETDEGICHSHDYCDANMVMHEAFAETFGRDSLDATNGMTDEDIETWNDAWAIAKAADFFA